MLARWTRGVSRDEWLRLSGFGAAVLALHVLGWGLFLYYSGTTPRSPGSACAYTFGLRHAFDADHIAAIDNTTRKLLQEGKRPLGVGFFFSLGHSTIVFALAAGLAIARARRSTRKIPAFQDYGGYIGASRLGHVPVDHRHPEPDRPARHPAHLPPMSPGTTTASGSRSACSTAAS